MSVSLIRARALQMSYSGTRIVTLEVSSCDPVMLFYACRAAMQMELRSLRRVGRRVMALTHVVGNLRANTEGTEGNDGKELLTTNEHSHNRYYVSGSCSTPGLHSCRVPFSAKLHHACTTACDLNSSMLNKAPYSLPVSRHTWQDSSAAGSFANFLSVFCFAQPLRRTECLLELNSN